MNKKLIITLLCIIMLILFVITTYLLYKNFYVAPSKPTSLNIYNMPIAGTGASNEKFASDIIDGEPYNTFPKPTTSNKLPEKLILPVYGSYGELSYFETELIFDYTVGGIILHLEGDFNWINGLLEVHNNVLYMNVWNYYWDGTKNVYYNNNVMIEYLIPNTKYYCKLSIDVRNRKTILNLNNLIFREINNILLGVFKNYKLGVGGTLPPGTSADFPNKRYGNDKSALSFAGTIYKLKTSTDPTNVNDNTSIYTISTKTINDVPPLLNQNTMYDVLKTPTTVSLPEQPIPFGISITPELQQIIPVPNSSKQYIELKTQIVPSNPTFLIEIIFKYNTFGVVLNMESTTATHPSASILEVNNNILYMNIWDTDNNVDALKFYKIAYPIPEYLHPVNNEGYSKWIYCRIATGTNLYKNTLTFNNTHEIIMMNKMIYIPSNEFKINIGKTSPKFMTIEQPFNGFINEYKFFSPIPVNYNIYQSSMYRNYTLLNLSPSTTPQTTIPAITEVPTFPHATSNYYTYKGCFNDNPNNRAIPNLLTTNLTSINVNNINDCYNLASRGNYNVFGVQLGNCYASNDNINNPEYAKYGESTTAACNNILGNVNLNQVYTINDVSTPTQTAASSANNANNANDDGTITTSAATTVPNAAKCSELSLMMNRNDCNSEENCYYANMSCYYKSQITPLNTINNTNFRCQIGESPDKKGYLLTCPNIDPSNYLFKTISLSPDCSSADNTCNIIIMGNSNNTDLQQNLQNIKNNTVQYINGSLPSPLYMNRNTASFITDEFKNTSGVLYFTDIYDKTIEVPYTMVPSIKDFAYSGNKLLSPDSNLLSDIQNLNKNIRANLNLIIE